MLTLLLSWICYRLAFHFPYKNRPVGNHNLPDRALYRKIHDRINNLIDEAESFPTEEVFIRSYDGLRLAGHIYEQASAAPVFIFTAIRARRCGTAPAFSVCFAMKDSM